MVIVGGWVILVDICCGFETTMITAAMARDSQDDIPSPRSNDLADGHRRDCEDFSSRSGKSAWHSEQSTSVAGRVLTVLFLGGDVPVQFLSPSEAAIISSTPIH